VWECERVSAYAQVCVWRLELMEACMLRRWHVSTKAEVRKLVSVRPRVGMKTLEVWRRVGMQMCRRVCPEMGMEA
jgi:hypothetical protein